MKDPPIVGSYSSHLWWQFDREALPLPKSQTGTGLSSISLVCFTIT